MASLQSCCTTLVEGRKAVLEFTVESRRSTLPTQIASAVLTRTIRDKLILQQSQRFSTFNVSSSSRSSFLGRKVSIEEYGRNVQTRARNGAGGSRALFTGLVEEMGKVRELKKVENDGVEMTIECSLVLEGVQIGDSIAVNGTCLTVIRFDSESFSVGLAPETLRKTSLGEVEYGGYVNLERSVTPSTRMGGHFVQGHVDGTGTIVSFQTESDSLWVKIKTSPDLLKYIVPKGYIAVDGTSLTVVNVLDDESCFTFMLVAYTQQRIVIPQKKVGDKVNLEVDILGKYVERLLQGYRGAEAGSVLPDTALPVLS